MSCNEGACGACTVTVSKRGVDGKICHFAVNACLVKLVSLHGTAITTIEGLGSVTKGLHPLQEQLFKGHGSQCGFCSPGMVMSSSSVFRQKAEHREAVDVEDIETCLQGNLCRCTGYRPILEAFEKLCGTDTNFPQDPQHPPELGKGDVATHLHFKGQYEWYRPSNLMKLQQLSKSISNVTYVGGGNGHYKCQELNDDVTTYIDLGGLKDLKTFHETETHFEFGSGLRLTEMLDVIGQLLQGETNNLSQLRAFFEVLSGLASNQIRNTATVGGVLMWPHSCADLVVLCTALLCSVETLDMKGNVTDMQMTGDYFPNQMRRIKKNKVLITKLKVDKLCKNSYVGAFKKAKRKTFDLAVLNAAASLRLEGSKIKSFRVVFGGSDGNGQSFEKFSVGDQGLSNAIVGSTLPMKWSKDHKKALKNVVSGTYRQGLAEYFLKNFFELIQSSSDRDKPQKNPIKRSVQVYHDSKGEDRVASDTVELPIPHIWADEQVSGSAVYVDDMPKLTNELSLVLIHSTKTKAKIKSIDFQTALAVPGVVGHVSDSDLKGDQNLYGLIVPDEPIFATHSVSHHGQVIAGLVCTTLEAGHKARKMVKIEYEEDPDFVLSINDAMAKGRLESLKPFFGPQKLFRYQEPEAMKQPNLKTLSGSVHVGGQEHFYLEPTNVLVIPIKEKQEFVIHVSSQEPETVQGAVSRALDLPRHKITAKTKRVGGAFGGKERTHTSLMAAVAANKFQKPVRLTLTSPEDMTFTGARHSFKVDYDVALNDEGKIIDFKAVAHASAGISADLSPVWIQDLGLRMSGGYTLKNFSYEGNACETNVPSNTAMRGFGGPEASIVIETVMDHASKQYGFDPIRIREKNMTSEGDLLHYSDKRLKGVTLEKCWQTCLHQSKFHQRLQDVIAFNASSKDVKQGIAIVPMKMDPTMLLKHSMQGSASVMVYKDGSVLLHHGGVEMGQGLSTKMVQVASKVLGIPPSMIHTSDTCTANVPNASPTGGSTGTDLNGPAVLQACQTIAKRLQPYKDSNPNGSWTDWVMKAYLNKTCLAAFGHYDWSEIGFNFQENTGVAFEYMTYGAGAIHVELNCVTGDVTVLSADLVIDLGNSINPAIDVGQAEGAFVQALGYLTTEQLLRASDNGKLLTVGPGAYKVPNISDLPHNLNVTFLKHQGGPTSAIFSSKGIGEPPFILCSGILNAIRFAISAYRQDQGDNSWINLNPPLTPEKISLICMGLDVKEQLFKSVIES